MHYKYLLNTIKISKTAYWSAIKKKENDLLYNTINRNKKQRLRLKN